MEAIVRDDTCEPLHDLQPAPAPIFMEHRFGQRFRCGTTVRICAGEGASGRARLVNVSLSGACLETALDLPLFATLEISAVNERGKAVELFASVVRKDARGVGVEWCDTPSRSICEIFGCTRHCEVA